MCRNLLENIANMRRDMKEILRGRIKTGFRETLYVLSKISETFLVKVVIFTLYTSPVARSGCTYASGIFMYAITWILLGEDSQNNLSRSQWKDFMVLNVFMPSSIVCMSCLSVCLFDCS